MAACDEAARKREARRGKLPTQATVSVMAGACCMRVQCRLLTPAPPPCLQWRPYDVTDSWPHKWHRQLHWRRWGFTSALVCDLAQLRLLTRTCHACAAGPRSAWAAA